MTLFLSVLQTTDKHGKYKKRVRTTKAAASPQLPRHPQKTAHQFSRMYTIIIVGETKTSVNCAVL